MNRINCTFKGHCGNKMEREYCTNIPSISCSWQEPQPDWQNEGPTKTVSRFDGSQPDQSIAHIVRFEMPITMYWWCLKCGERNHKDNKICCKCKETK